MEKISLIAGIVSLAALGITAMMTGTDTGIIQFIIGGITGAVSTLAGVSAATKTEETE
jgi:hypothetical protein